MGWQMHCEVHRAVDFAGELRVDDPDGIVVDAAFVTPDARRPPPGRLLPLGARPARGLAARPLGRRRPARAFHFEITGSSLADFEVVAASEGVSDPAARRSSRRLRRPAPRPVGRRRAWSPAPMRDERAVDPAPRPRRVLRVGRAARATRSSGAGRWWSAASAAGAWWPRRATRRATFGIHSAMPTARARRLCPRRGVRRARASTSTRRSAGEVMAILRSATPLVEPLSLDEAFLDVARRDAACSAPGPEIGAELRRRIRAELALTASVGVATTKMLAKIASDSAKPDGLLVIEPGTELAFLHPLPVRRLWGVGPGDAAQARPTSASSTVGRPGRDPGAGARRQARRGVGPPPARAGREPRPAPGGAGPGGQVDRARGDVRDRPQRPPRRSSRTSCGWPTAVASRLREHAKVARTVQLKLRYRDFATITRAHTLPDADRSRGHDRRRGARRCSTRSTCGTGSGCSA